MRYDRQIILPEVGEEGQKKLQEAKVLIVGVGGLGSPIALYLAGAGVGCLGLVDDDLVSITNLQRQVLYSEKELGKPKAICAAERLSALNSEIEIHPYAARLTKDNAYDIIQEYDIVVDGCDNFATRYLINDICIKQKKPTYMVLSAVLKDRFLCSTTEIKRKTTGIFIPMKKKCNGCLLHPKE